MGRSYGVVGVAQRSLASEGAGCLTIKSGRSSGTRELPVIIFGVMFTFCIFALTFNFSCFVCGATS